MKLAITKCNFSTCDLVVLLDNTTTINIVSYALQVSLINISHCPVVILSSYLKLIWETKVQSYKIIHRTPPPVLHSQ